jgi:hypothetical protein
MKLLGFMVLGVFWASHAWAKNGLVPHLFPSSLRAIQTLLSSSGDQDWEKLEKTYQGQIHRQVLADLSLLYDPANQNKVKITYASFTPESQIGGGEDGGFGLHIVKRLILPLEGGLTKIIYVNEQWPQDARSGGLFAPDEIRIQTLFRPTDTSRPGSHEDFLFDSIRLAWGPLPQDVQILRQTVHEWDQSAHKNRYKPLRVPISAPFSCRDCHESSNALGDGFLAKGEKKNFAAIVQDSQFNLPVEKMRGFKEYLTALTKQGRPPEMIETVRTQLLNPIAASAVPNLLEALQDKNAQNSLDWLPEAIPLKTEIPQMSHRQGFYVDLEGNSFLDSLEEVIEGKYRWWDPIITIPQ